MHKRILREGPAFSLRASNAVARTRSRPASNVTDRWWNTQDGPPSVETPRELPVLRHWRGRPGKRWRRTPARLLEIALEPSEHGRDDARGSGLKSTNVSALEKDRRRDVDNRMPAGAMISNHGLTLPTILADYINEMSLEKARDDGEVVPHDDRGVTSRILTDPAVLAHLESKRYTIGDVERWYSIVACKDSTAAFKMIDPNASSAFDQTRQTSRLCVPTFVFLRALRRDRISPEALRIALSYTWSRLDPEGESFARTKDNQISAVLAARPKARTNDRLPLYIVAVRLLNFARMVLPEALSSVARIFTTMLERTQPPIASGRLNYRRHRVASWTAVQCNRVLKLLSLPCSVRPFLSTVSQHTAQFHVLQYMAQQRPVIPVTREGYQAIARVQLASKKTSQERDWASLKANTWPPWKEDKIGFDAEKGPDYGVSQALHAIRHAQQAGYGSGRWERVAQILSGWDTGGSPTIQTRSWLLPRTATSRRRGRNVLFDRLQWAARIQATRTVQEAWGSFLTYTDRGMPPEQVIYFAMFRKLLAGHLAMRRDSTIRHERERGQLETVQGGDAREVFPTPISQKEGVYVRTAPPSMDMLAEQMFRQGITPSGQCLAFLVSNAASLTMGVKYLEWARPFDRNIDGLLTSNSHLDPRVSLVPSAIFNAFIRLLCRCHYAQISAYYPARDLSGDKVNTARPITVEIKDPLLRALRLMDARKPQFAPPWHALLEGLSSVRLSAAITDTRECQHEAQELERWHLSQSVRRKMRDAGIGIDLESYRFLCRTLERSALAALKIQAVCDRHSKCRSSESPLVDPDLADKARKLLSISSSYVRRLFYELFGTPDARSITHDRQKAQSRHETDDGIAKGRSHDEVPRLLASPEPVLLHFYVRVLGVLGQHHIMLELVRWMAVYKDEINAAAARPRNGQRILIRTLVAIRVFSERSWMAPTADSETNVRTHQVGTKGPKGAAPAITVQKMRELVESVEDWGGWPTDEETEEYCEGRLVCSLAQLDLRRFDRM